MAFMYLISVLFILLNSSVKAITDGELDGNKHPYVGLLACYDENKQYKWRCSCVLVSDKIILTGGHCTGGADRDGNDVQIKYATAWFDTDIDAGMPENGYREYGKGDVWGRVFAHPLYDSDVFWRHDLGVVVIDDQSKDFQIPSLLGELPTNGQFNDLQAGRGTTFDAVGYGVQGINPSYVEAKKIRMIANPWLIQKAVHIAGEELEHSSWVLSNNRGLNSGGFCFGDGGGPILMPGTNIITGLSSFVLNLNCAGTGGVYRIDQADDLNWLAEVFAGKFDSDSKPKGGPHSANAIISQRVANEPRYYPYHQLPQPYEPYQNPNYSVLEIVIFCSIMIPFSILCIAGLFYLIKVNHYNKPDYDFVKDEQEQI